MLFRSRQERKALAKQKIEPPGTFDGKPDLAVFDKWTYEVNTWVKLTKLRETTAINLLVKYTSGSAGDFFMNFITGNEERWTLEGVLEGIFEYCFPPDFKDRLRAQLSNATQGKRRIRDFVRDIEKLTARFPDVNERAVIQTFWNSMNHHIHLRLIEWGTSPEHTSLERIIKRSIAMEASGEAYRRELSTSKVEPPKREWGRFVNRTTGPQPYRPVDEGTGSTYKGSNLRVRTNAVAHQHSYQGSKGDGRQRQG